MWKKINPWVAGLVAISCCYAGGAWSDPGASSNDPHADYDRLDGKGPSGKKVHVIEWEGNLEIHVYPVGSLSGLALKLDKRNKDKPVMVIGYRFDNNPKEQLIRRAILGIDLREGFKTYRDPTADGYDKIIISNNGLSSEVVAYKLDPEPTQLYPDGHPANTKLASQEHGPGAPGLKAGRAPAAAAKRSTADSARPDEKPLANEHGEDGTIQPFAW